ncbi:hypothetical protein Tco_0232885 [Tanacetum coccineum]
MPEQIGVGEFSPLYYISQLGDSLIISGSFSDGDCRIIYAWALEVEGGFVSSYRLLFTIPYPADHDLKLLGFSKDNKPIVEAAIVQQWHRSLQVFNPTFKIILGSAGIVQQAKLLKEKVLILSSDGALMSTQEYIQKVVKDVGEDDDFKSGPWVSATNYVNTNGGTVNGYLGDIKNFLKNGKLDQVDAIVKSCSPNAIGDLTLTMKDLTSTIPGDELEAHDELFRLECGAKSDSEYESD